jgi:hypothetical protein
MSNGIKADVLKTPNTTDAAAPAQEGPLIYSWPLRQYVDGLEAELKRLRPVYAAAEYIDIAYSTDVVSEEDAQELLKNLRDAVRAAQEADRAALAAPSGTS